MSYDAEDPVVKLLQKEIVGLKATVYQHQKLPPNLRNEWLRARIGEAFAVIAERLDYIQQQLNEVAGVD